MKKIFTLISMALVAMSMNAQEIWDASEQLTFAEEVVEETTSGKKTGMVLQGMTTSPNTTATLKTNPTIYNLPDGAQPTEEQVKADATADLQLNDYTFTGETANVTLTAVSTPNSGTLLNEVWKLGGADNVLLTEANLAEECVVPFGGQYVVAGNGNPSLGMYEYYFTNSDKQTVGPRYYETYWTIGCGELPKKGAYFKFNTKSAGTLIIGFFLNKNLNANDLLIVDGDTKAPLAQDKIDVLAFRQHCNYEMEKGSETHLVAYTLDENYLVNSDIMGSDTNRPLYGYVAFDTEANKDYYMFSHQSQMGIYGFYFAGTTGITNVAAKADNTNAPMYNLAGQKVANDFKGMVIQNGRKFMNK